MTKALLLENHWGAYICLYDDQVARDFLVVEPLSQDDGAKQRQRDVEGPVCGLRQRRLELSWHCLSKELIIWQTKSVGWRSHCSWTYRVSGVVLDGVLDLAIGAVVDVCGAVVPPETREDGGSHRRQLWANTHTHMRARKHRTVREDNCNAAHLSESSSRGDFEAYWTSRPIQARRTQNFRAAVLSSRCHSNYFVPVTGREYKFQAGRGGVSFTCAWSPETVKSLRDGGKNCSAASDSSSLILPLQLLHCLYLLLHKEKSGLVWFLLVSIIPFSALKVCFCLFSYRHEYNTKCSMQGK